MRFYSRITEDQKIELSIYPQEMEDEVGSAFRLTADEARMLMSILERSIEEVEEA